MRAATAGDAFDGRHRRKAPLVDAAAALRQIRGGGQLPSWIAALCLVLLAWTLLHVASSD